MSATPSCDRMGSASGYTLIELMVAVAITLFVMAGVFGLMIQNQQLYETQTRLSDVQQAARVALDLMTREIRMAGSDPSGTTWTPNVVGSCLGGSYQTPASAAAPAGGDVAPLTVATASTIRIKMDRPTYALGPEPSTTPTPTPSPGPYTDCNGDGLYTLDGENGFGDGFLNDEGEDIQYQWVASEKRLYRTETKTDPQSACRCTGAPAAPSPSTVVIAENVVDFSLLYYTTDPPQASCPVAGNYADSAAYETARATCDPPAAFPVGDLSAIRRVRIRIVVETNKPDPRRPTTAPKYGKQWITLASEATIRNRNL